ncbi:Protein shq1 [Bienertia sinuspersici]
MEENPMANSTWLVRQLKEDIRANTNICVASLKQLCMDRNLRDAFKQHGVQKDDWTFIIDRMKGVDKAMFEIFPRATRRVCAHHLYSNWKGSCQERSAMTCFGWMQMHIILSYTKKPYMLSEKWILILLVTLIMS